MNISISHKIGQIEALKRIEVYVLNSSLVANSQISNLNVSQNANNVIFSFKFKGISIKGTITVQDCEVLIKSSIPFVFYPFKAQIEKIIRQQAETILK